MTLPVLGDMPRRAVPKAKIQTRKSAKSRKQRAEALQKKVVRLKCVLRDGQCRLLTETVSPEFGVWLWLNGEKFCSAESEWAHLHTRRRSQTRNQAPEIRHDTKHSLMLCRFHHREYDAHRLQITALTRAGADGPLKFSRAK